ncbi:MAG TPA: hypothetical protein DD381_01480 [Lentisphaeria bacterium]|nr:MAG: hypothetical protein A2X47_10550 [Lentisphaerae bacterium GWF2_38_69]HBM15014.1 hypothetical protein [Lentisphaeria bacterium]
MRIALFSDSHTFSPPSSWNACFDKRAIGLVNYFYIRKHKHNPKYLEKVVQKILDISPDMVICTGDLTTSGDSPEFDLSCSILSPLVENQSFELFYVLGNHDYYVKDKVCYEALRKAFCYLNRGRFNLEDLPQSLEIKDLDFCFVNVCKPVNLFVSYARMSRKNRDFIINWAEKKTQKPKILVEHYPLIEEHPVLRCRHKLWGEKQVLQKLQSGEIDLSLCGHVHCPTQKLDERGRGEVIIGSATANKCFALIEYDENSDVFKYNKISVE